MSATASILLFLSGIVLGVFLCPVILFLRARRDRYWDDSNMTNIIRVLAHLATHPGDFAKFRYEDGRRPFWYLDKDELSEVVDTRPPREPDAGGRTLPPLFVADLLSPKGSPVHCPDCQSLNVERSFVCFSGSGEVHQIRCLDCNREFRI